jgi:hypothetical protein
MLPIKNSIASLLTVTNCVDTGYWLPDNERQKASGLMGGVRYRAQSIRGWAKRIRKIRKVELGVWKENDD